ncbi:hypothetical protein GQ54DRAFT_242814, partial [Martensiomyces pterosporus]
MAPNPNQSKISSRLEKAAKQAKQPRTKRKQHAAHTSDDESDVEVEWGDKLEDNTTTAGGQSSATATPSARRVTRQSGMTNKQVYKSVVVNGATYQLGQAVRVRSSSDDPYLATIYKMWENEQGEKQIVARWLLRKSEMYVNNKKSEIDAEPCEVFYSNADDLISPGMIVGSLDVLSFADFEKRFPTSPALPDRNIPRKELHSVYFCRRYFNEQTAFLGQLDWETFYHGGKILDPIVDQAMFRKEEKKRVASRPIPSRVGRARGAARQPRAGAKAPPAPKTPRGSKRRKA